MLISHHDVIDANHYKRNFAFKHHLLHYISSTTYTTLLQISLTMKEVPQGEDAVLDMPTHYNGEDEDVTSNLGDAFAKLVWKDED